MKKFYCLLLALSLVSFLPLAAQDAQHQEESSPLNKEENSETPAAEEGAVELAALSEDVVEIDPEEKNKISETEKKAACINVSPSEQKANNKEQAKKSKPNATKEKVNKSPKCTKSKKEAEASKKKPKASSRVKLVSYRPGLY